ncbi:MAG: gluconate 2-dehydrogenase subunit 3 family protein [Myxococcota bacterium]
MSVDRRRFLALAGGGAFAAGGVVWWTLRNRDPSPSVPVSDRRPTAVVPKPRGSDLVLTRDEVLGQQHMVTLSSVVDRIYPSDGDEPGALDVGAFDYIMEQLRRRDMQSARRILMRGAAQANRLAVRVGNGLFSMVSEEQRDEVVASMLAGEGARGSFVPQEFVQFMVALTLEGMFAHPVYGGNLDGRGWTLIDYAGACRAPTLEKPL